MSDVIKGFPQGNFDDKEEDMQKGQWNWTTTATDQQDKDIKGISGSMQQQDSNLQRNLDEDMDKDIPLQPWKNEMVNPEVGTVRQKEEINLRETNEPQIQKGEQVVGQNFGEQQTDLGGNINMDFREKKSDTESRKKPHLDLRGSQKIFPAQELVYHSLSTEKDKDKDIDTDQDRDNTKTDLTEHQNEWTDQLNQSSGEKKQQDTKHKAEHPQEVSARRHKQQHIFPQPEPESRLNALAQDYERQKVAIEEQLHRNKQQQKLEKMALKQQMKPTQHFMEGKRDQYDIDRQHQKNQNQMPEKRKAHQEIQTSVKAVK